MRNLRANRSAPTSRSARSTSTPMRSPAAMFRAMAISATSCVCETLKSIPWPASASCGRPRAPRRMATAAGGTPSASPSSRRSDARPAIHRCRSASLPKRAARAVSAGASQVARSAISSGVRSSAHHQSATPGATGASARGPAGIAVRGSPVVGKPWVLRTVSAAVARPATEEDRGGWGVAIARLAPIMPLWRCAPAASGPASKRPGKVAPGGVAFGGTTARGEARRGRDECRASAPRVAGPAPLRRADRPGHPAEGRTAAVPGASKPLQFHPVFC